VTQATITIKDDCNIMTADMKATTGPLSKAGILAKTM
jgi:hypothetical protein